MTTHNAGPRGMIQLRRRKLSFKECGEMRDFEVIRIAKRIDDYHDKIRRLILEIGESEHLFAKLLQRTIADKGCGFIYDIEDVVRVVLKPKKPNVVTASR